MRLLERDVDGKLTLREFTGKDVPTYAILSHTWHPDNSEVRWRDPTAGLADDGE